VLASAYALCGFSRLGPLAQLFPVQARHSKCYRSRKMCRVETRISVFELLEPLVYARRKLKYANSRIASLALQRLFSGLPTPTGILVVGDW
jgi:hypothetical protein